MKRTLTSFDVAAIVLELKKTLEGARIQNIYQLKENTFIVKMHQPGSPSINLLIESGKRLHLTNYLFDKPQKPPAFCMALRKYLRNGVIKRINQHEFERIVVIDINAGKGEFTLILELFGDGNVILVNAQGIIQQALITKKMRDRNILLGELFLQPPSSGENPMHVMPQDLNKLREFKDLKVVKALTKFLSVGGTYSEELLLRARVDKNKSCSSLEKSDLDRIFTALNEIISPLEAGNFTPQIIIEKNERWIDVTPIPLKLHEQSKHKDFNSFNEALDEYYVRTLVERKVKFVIENAEEKMAQQLRILREQQESLEHARQEAEQSRKVGDKIYSHFNQFHMLLQSIIKEKKGGKTWESIVSGINREKEAGKEPSVFFETLDTKKLLLNVSVEGLAFVLSLQLSVQGNAATFYDRAKKAEKKITGAKKAIEETLSRIEALRNLREIDVEEKSKPIEKRRKKAWFEKYRWFYTSEDLLVVGGKDAITNEILIKKHMEPQDLVFHADLAGAPFVLIKTKGKEPAKQSIVEAAQLAASHSGAWKAKFSALDVYWVKPNQVSKTPPSGEYLSRGAFMIRGKKNYVRKCPIRLAIGIDVRRKPLVISGPTEALRNKTNIFVEIVPGELSSSKLAQNIQQVLKQKAPKNIQEEISKIPIEDIQKFIPYGKGKLSSS